MTELSVDIDGGAAVGYRVHGDRPAPTPQRGPADSASVSATGQQCATQVGTTLWLGVEVVNDGPGPVLLKSISFTTPLGGLEAQAGIRQPGDV